MFKLGISGQNAAMPAFARALAAGGFAARSVSHADELSEIDTLLLMPNDVLECERLLFEREAFARDPRGVTTIILSATLSPRYVRALRNRVPGHIALVDAPMVGLPSAIKRCQGSFLIGGPRDLVNRISPIFALIGHGQARMGEFGTATAAKALQDCISAASSAMTRSALGWAEAQGIEETRLLSFLRATLVRQLPPGVDDPADLVTNTLPGDHAGVTLVRDVETALDAALAGVHLDPPRTTTRALQAPRSRHLH